VDDLAAGQWLVDQLLADGVGELVVEEYLTGRPSEPFGDYVSVEHACVDGVLHHIGTTGKFPLAPPFRETGGFWPAVLSAAEHARVVDLAGDALRALGVRTGLLHTEIKLTASGPRLIEVNGRLGGDINDLSRRAAGRDLVTTAAAIALGLPADIDPRPAGGVVFQHNNPAPPVTATAVRIDGAAEVRRQAGVSSYAVYVRPGDTVAGGVGYRPLDNLCGAAADHAAMISLIDAADRLLAYTFRVDGIERTVDGPALRGWRP
jgi:hypothetical protein